MNKLSTFFITMFKSLTSVDYYKDVVAAKMAFSIKYFLMLALTFSTVMAIRVSILNIPVTKRFFAEFLVAAKAYYPSGLVLNAKDNQWTINQPEPYSLPNPFLGDPFTRDVAPPMPKNLITFYHNGTIEDLQNQDTLMLVNGKNVITRDNGGFSAQPIENLPDGSFSQQNFNSLIDSAAKFSAYLPAAIVLISLASGILAYLLSKSIYIAFASLVVLLACFILGYQSNYGKAARLTIHTLTLPAVIELIVSLAGYRIPVPFWFFIVNLVFVTVVILNIRKRGEIDQKAAIDHNNTV
jgi:hypothetical protein